MTLVCYSDDVLELSRPLQHIEEKFSILESGYSKLELEFNSEKSEILLFNWGNLRPTPSVQLGNSFGKPVEKLIYLGLPIGPFLKQTRLLLIPHFEKKFGAI